MDYRSIYEQWCTDPYFDEATKAELKAYTKGVSVYRRITKPYNDARNLIIQAENYTHLAEIEALYESVMVK